MMNPPNDPDLHAVIYEASCRIRVAVQMLHWIEDRSNDEPDFDGYDLGIAREVMEDVASTLAAAAEHLISEPDGGGDAETATRRD